MPLVTERVLSVTTAHPIIEGNIGEVDDILETHLGKYECRRQQEAHLATWNHQRETGALVMGALDFAFDGIGRGSERARRLHRHTGAAAGGAHDLLKTTNDRVMRIIDTPGDIGPKARHWVTYTHCRLTGDAGLHDRVQKVTPLTRYIVHTIQNHHGLFVDLGRVDPDDVRCAKPLIQSFPSPAEYSAYSSRDALAWAYTHITNICDKLHALAFDTSREAYRAQREGRHRLPPEKVYELVIGPAHADPRLNGRLVPMDLYVKHVLGLPEGFALEG